MLRINGLFHLLIDGVFLVVITQFLSFDPNLFEVSKHPIFLPSFFKAYHFLGSLHLYMKRLEVERKSISVGMVQRLVNLYKLRIQVCPKKKMAP